MNYNSFMAIRGRSDGSAENGGPEKQGRNLQDQYSGKCKTGKSRTGFWRTISQEQETLRTNTFARRHLTFLVVSRYSICSTSILNKHITLHSHVKCSSRLLMLSRSFSQRNWMICSFCASGTRVFCLIIWATVVSFHLLSLWSSFFRSCIFQPCKMVLQLQVLHFQVLHFPVLQFSVLHFQSSGRPV